MGTPSDTDGTDSTGRSRTEPKLNKSKKKDTAAVEELHWIQCYIQKDKIEKESPHD